MVETAGFSPGETGSTRSAVPIAKRSRVETLLHRIEPVDIGGFARPPTRARRRYIARYTGLVLLLAGIAYGGVWLTSMEYPWYLTLGGVLIAPLAAHLKWRHRGYAITDGYVITRNGFWRRTTKIVPLHRVQVVFDSQTIFQRRWGLATLTVDTAGSQSLINDNSKAVDIDATTAARLRETITDRFFDDLDRQRQQREASTGSPPVSPKPAE